MYLGSGTYRVHTSSAMCSEASSSCRSTESSFEYLAYQDHVLRDGRRESVVGQDGAAEFVAAYADAPPHADHQRTAAEDE